MTNKAATKKGPVLVKSRLWPELGYEPHPSQVEIHSSSARHKVAACGRRFGKSQIGGHELTAEALYTYTVAQQWLDQGKRREFWITGPEYSDSEKEFRVVWNDLKRLEVPFDHPGSYYNAEASSMSISLWGGAFLIHAKSAKYPATLVGEGLSGVIMAEAAKMKPSVWRKYIRPTLADFVGWSLHTSTPEGKNHFYDMWKRGQDPNDSEWSSWRKPSWSNPFVFPLGKNDPEVLDMAKDMSKELADQEIAAKFNTFVGRVFKDFDEEIHVTDVPYDSKLPLYGACDYGYTNPFVWLSIQTDVWGNVYVLDEYRRVQMDISDIAKELAQTSYGKLTREFYPDPASPGDTRVLEKALKAKGQPKTGGELKDRLEMIRQALKVGPAHAPLSAQRPKLFIDRKCKGLIYELSEMKYPEHKNESTYEPENPEKKNDHGPEALGRFFKGKLTDTTKTSARVSTANIGRKS